MLVQQKKCWSNKKNVGQKYIGEIKKWFQKNWIEKTLDQKK